MSLSLGSKPIRTVPKICSALCFVLPAFNAFAQSPPEVITEEMIFGAGTVVAYQAKCDLKIIDPYAQVQVQHIYQGYYKDHRFIEGYRYGLQAVDMGKYVFGDLVCHSLVSVVNADRSENGLPPLFDELN